MFHPEGDQHFSRDRVWPLVIVGGGPAAARQLLCSGVPVTDVCVVSSTWSNGMGFLGTGVLQSYVDELDVGDGGAGLTALLGTDRIRPSAAQFDDYVRTVLEDFGATLVTGTVTAMQRGRGGLRLVVTHGAGSSTITAERVVLATGSRPRTPPAEWRRAGAVTYDVFHRTPPERRRERCRGRSVVVVGSGNSALQTAALVAPLATDTTVLANRYHGLYPFETSDRFAWRAPSALTCELVVKGATACRASGGTTPCVRLLVYDDLDVDEGELRFTYWSDGNGDLLTRSSLPPRCRHTAASALPGHRRGWIERRRLDDVVILWATGSEPVYPDVDVLRGLPHDPSGYLLSDEAGRTAIEGLYLTGACSGQRAVNEMRPALEARLDDLDDLGMLSHTHHGL